MKKLFGYLILIPALLVQCNPENDATPEILTESPSGAGVLLAEVKPEKDYIIQFVEIEPGTIAMHASYSGDLKDFDKASLTDINTDGKSILEVYKTLAKDKINKVQLKALEAAYERLQQPASSLLEVDYSALNPRKSGNTEARVDNSLRTDCFLPPGAPDFADDATWWRDTFGRFIDQSANQTDQSFEVTCREVRFYAMATDYEFGGYFTVYHKNKNGSWHTWMDTYMPARTWHEYGLWSNKRHVYKGVVTGIAPCARVNLGYKVPIW